jgi:hypothetical protein
MAFIRKIIGWPYWIKSLWCEYPNFNPDLAMWIHPCFVATIIPNIYAYLIRRHFNILNNYEWQPEHPIKAPSSNSLEKLIGPVKKNGYRVLLGWQLIFLGLGLIQEVYSGGSLNNV